MGANKRAKENFPFSQSELFQSDWPIVCLSACLPEGMMELSALCPLQEKGRGESRFLPPLCLSLPHPSPTHQSPHSITQIGHLGLPSQNKPAYKAYLSGQSPAWESAWPLLMIGEVTVAMDTQQRSAYQRRLDANLSRMKILCSLNDISLFPRI